MKDTLISGDISNLAKPSIGSIEIATCFGLYGDVSTLKNCTNLTNLRVNT